MECTVTVPTGSTQRINGKILAVTGYGVNDNDVAKRYCSFASIGKSYIGSLNATSSLLKIRFYGGNQSYGKADGTKITDITAYGYVFYIGSGKIVPTSPCGYEIDDETD